MIRSRTAFASSALLLACFAPLAACSDDHEALDTAGFEEAYAQNELGKTDTGGCSGVADGNNPRESNAPEVFAISPSYPDCF